MSPSRSSLSTPSDGATCGVGSPRAAFSFRTCRACNSSTRSRNEGNGSAPGTQCAKNHASHSPSAPTTEELVRALTDPKFKLTPAEQRELLGDYLPYCTAVRMPARMPKVPRCRDPFDVAFLQLTSAGKART